MKALPDGASLAVVYAGPIRAKARESQPDRRKPATGPLQAKRIAWGHDSGAKVAEAYRLRTEGN